LICFSTFPRKRYAELSGSNASSRLSTLKEFRHIANDVDINMEDLMPPDGEEAYPNDSSSPTTLPAPMPLTEVSGSSLTPGAAAGNVKGVSTKSGQKAVKRNESLKGARALDINLGWKINLSEAVERGKKGFKQLNSLSVYFSLTLKRASVVRSRSPLEVP
jgi:hypothetical protein